MEGEDGEKKVKYPFGFRFVPKDEELVEYYLLPRLQGRATVPNDAVVEANVYACHPDTLTSGHKNAGAEEWYFLSPRTRMYGNGVRPARKTLDGRGRWKASTAAKEVEEGVLCSGVKFCKSVLNYFEGSPKKEARTKWIMLEITVPEYEIKLDAPGANNLLDEFVMCKIYVSPQHKKKGDEEEEEEEGTGLPLEEEGASSSTQNSQRTAEPKLDKQAGKRPMIEPPQLDRAAPARKQARHQGSLSIGSTQASYSTSSAASPTTGVYFGVPGRPYGLQQVPPVQRPPAGAYNGQAPANPPAGAFGGQRLAQLPTPTPVIYQPFSKATDDPFNLMATLTGSPNSAKQAAGPPPCLPANPPREHPATAFRPQVSLQCCYDQNYRAVQQPPGNGSSSSRPQSLAAFLPPQQAQQPFFNGQANPRGPTYSCYPYQRSSSAPPADGHDRAANERNGAARLPVNAEQYFTDLAKNSARRQPAADGRGQAANETNGTASLNFNAEKYFISLDKISARRPQPAADGHDRAANLNVNYFMDFAKINPLMAGARPQPAPAQVESPAPAPARAAKVEAETGETSAPNTQDAT